MHFATLFTSLSLLATVVSAVPHRLKAYRRASGAQNVVYWGQNGGGTVENNDLSTYCTSTAGIDVIVLAFLYQYGNGNEVASGVIGQSCSISTSSEPSQCDDLAAAISTCQANGVKVILSLGGAVGAYSLSSQQEAETIGQNLWDAYGNTGNGGVPRPFGYTFVNGWDFDIEASSGNQYYQYLISTLRSNFASDPSNTYYITGAPQCPIPEPNMQQIIVNSQFDYLWVQSTTILVALLMVRSITTHGCRTSLERLLPMPKSSLVYLPPQMAPQEPLAVHNTTSNQAPLPLW
jgi:Chitinase